MLTLLLLIVVYACGYYIYYAAFESSKWQATPGKRIMGQKVVNTNGERISFGIALGRNVCKILSGYILYIGYMMAGFTAHKQGLHDKLMDCLVIVDRGEAKAS